MSRMRYVLLGEDITIDPWLCYCIVNVDRNWLICLYESVLVGIVFGVFDITEECLLLAWI